jgi:hypothetical protein
VNFSAPPLWSSFKWSSFIHNKSILKMGKESKQ